MYSFFGCISGLRSGMESKMTKKIDNTTIGGRIKKRRNDLGLSQEELAEKLFTSKQMISAYENNKT